MSRKRNYLNWNARQDVDLLALALSDRWPVEPEKKREIVLRQVDILNDPNVSAHVKSRAAQNLVNMGRQNLMALEYIANFAQRQDPVIEATDEEIAAGLASQFPQLEYTNSSEEKTFPSISHIEDNPGSGDRIKWVRSWNGRLVRSA